MILTWEEFDNGMKIHFSDDDGAVGVGETSMWTKQGCNPRVQPRQHLSAHALNDTLRAGPLMSPRAVPSCPQDRPNVCDWWQAVLKLAKVMRLGG